MSENPKAAVGQNSAAWISAIAAQQDRAAFADLFEFYAPRIKTMMMHAGASADTGEDVARDALLAVWRKAVHFNGDRQSASTWIYTIARSVWGDHLRGKLLKTCAVNGMHKADERKRPGGRSTPRNAAVASALIGMAGQSSLHQGAARDSRPSSSGELVSRAWAND